MNRFDWGNHRTGHPKWAQLMAKTWKLCPSTFRTQHGISAVSTSKELTTGLRKVASRVCPGGNCSNGPRESQDSSPVFLSRIAGPRRKRTTGTAKTAATNPLKSKPILKSMARLVMPVSLGTGTFSSSGLGDPAGTLMEVLLLRGSGKE